MLEDPKVTIEFEKFAAEALFDWLSNLENDEIPPRLHNYFYAIKHALDVSVGTWKEEQAARQRRERERLEQKRKEFWAKRTKVYDRYVKIRPSCKTTIEAYRKLSIEFEIHHVAIQALVATRRSEIQTRRPKEALTYARRGYSNKKISTLMGVSERQAGRLVSEGRRRARK